VCFETGHLAINCKKLSEKHKTEKSRRKSTWWDGAKLAHQHISKDLPTELAPEGHISKDLPIESTPEAKSNESAQPTVEQKTVISSQPPSSQSWVDQANKENEQSKDWTEVVKKKKPSHTRQLVQTRSHTGSLK